MPDSTSPLIGAFSGLLAAGLAALGMNSRMSRIERTVLFKDTFGQFQKAHDDSIKEIRSDLKEQNTLLIQIHKDMPKRKDE